jgi:hypothetical protein
MLAVGTRGDLDGLRLDELAGTDRWRVPRRDEGPSEDVGDDDPAMIAAAAISSTSIWPPVRSLRGSEPPDTSTRPGTPASS